MNKKFCQQRAFTLMEIMVVVIVVGVIAGFALPNYGKAVERAYERDGMNNLILLSSAQEAYKSKYGDYWPTQTGACGGANCGLAGGLNTALGINIVENGMTYVCRDRGGGVNFACEARRIGGNNFTLYIDETLAPNPPNIPCCKKFNPVCPTVPNTACP
jgi:prepilin-type N-terminal cleavage/methylation domain-containing protein